MDARSILQCFNAKGVKIWVESGNIKIKSKPGLITDIEKDFVRENKAEILLMLVADSNSTHQQLANFDDRYALTPLQQAYWVGETGLYSYSSPAFFYEEYSAKSVDIDRLSLCIRKLIARHELLRARIHSDATQSTMSIEEQKSFVVTCTDLSKLTKHKRNKKLIAYRHDCQRNVSGIHDNPHFSMHVHRWKDGQLVHFLGRFIIGDGWSWTLFLKELAKLYEMPEYQFDPIGYSFRQYIEHLSEWSLSDKYQRSMDYWQARIPDLPPSPQLPVLDKCIDGGDKWQFMTRQSFSLGEASWQQLVQIARCKRLTPSTVLCTAFSEVLAVWSSSAHFIINLMYTRRENLHSDIENVFGNFSATMLLEIDLRDTNSFEKNAGKIQSQLFKDLEHSDIAGVDVARIINHQNGGGHELPSVPIVFASMVNDLNNTEQVAIDRLGWKKQYDSIITPQVLIDLQVEDQGSGIRINMDTQDGYYQDGILDKLFNSYQELISQLVNDVGVWENEIYYQLPHDFHPVRQEINDTNTNYPVRCLHELYRPQLTINDAKTAIYSPDRNYSYKDLHDKSSLLMKMMSAVNCDLNGKVIAVIADKNFAQISSVLAVLRSGAAYLPISLSMPINRINYVLKSCGVSLILKDTCVDLPELFYTQYSIIEVENTLVSGDEYNTEPLGEIHIYNPEQLAYIIFTSGSTGRPKGVMIKHAAAVNTIQDVNSRFAVGDQDRIMAFSPINFDLSVYDIFGSLAAGASMVLPESSLVQDSRYLIKLIIEQSITVINCVPAVMESIVEQAELQDLQLCSVRLVMMSGDWIPIGLPERINAVCKAQVVSLGGATEAAIWSCYFNIDSVDSAWNSIPYGYPLANQKLFILNERLEDCPNQVPGEIYIGGVGLAEGYWQDEEKTSAVFFNHPTTGERLYKTGDWGLYHENGMIEFLGRQDSQVKINGYRIELGEIEAVLSKVSGVDQAVVTVQKEQGTSSSITAFLKPTNGVTLEIDQVTVELATYVPGYMVPSNWIVLEHLPLTSNSKVDRKALSAYLTEQSIESTTAIAPRNKTETKLADIWAQVLAKNNLSVNVNFFELGGNSLLAIRMLSLVEQQFGVHIPIHDIFEANTIECLADIIMGDTTSDKSRHIICLNQRQDKPSLFLIHPIGGNLLCYSGFVKHLGPNFSIFGLQSLDVDSNEQLTIEDIASTYVDEILRFEHRGPFLIAGWSFGGVVGYEMSNQLCALGLHVRVIMIDPWVSKVSDTQQFSQNDYIRGFISDLIEGSNLPDWFTDPTRNNAVMTAGDILKHLKQHDKKFSVLSEKEFNRFLAIYSKNRDALTRYNPGFNNNDIHIIAAEELSESLCLYLQPLADFIARQEHLEENSQIHTLTTINHYNIISSDELFQLVTTIISS
ncbi:MAG: amino acid adenylation domain-containing protein [Candidatus Sedimenticola sp. (ex Thyasira tokunagai)]